MMRYLIVLGDREGLDLRLPAGWRTIVSKPRALACVPGGIDVHGSDDGKWVVLGRAFASAGADVRSAIASSRDVSALLSSIWGRYVALVSERDGARVLRDPSGRVPCFYARWRGALILFSSIEDARAAGWRDDGPDWENVAAFVQDGRIRDGRTGLRGVRELLPGASLSEDGACEAHWRPGQFAADLIEDRRTARDFLREAVLRSVAAIAKGQSHILHLLSGGLDSSVVLGCLRETVAPEQLSCLTFTQGEGSELDEVKYARMAADAAGAQLLVTRFDPGSVRVDRAEALTAQPRPLGYVFSIENDDAELAAAERLKPSLCTSGAGGDGLFFQLRARTYCADYLLRHGLTPRALSVAFDNARLSRASFWTILREGWRLAYRGGSFDPEAQARNPYLVPEMGGAGEAWLRDHPWFQDRAMSPGKRLHAWAVLDCLNLFYPYRRAEFVGTELPLVSQPVIEAVLRIPSWVHSDGGRDRTLLRECFNDLVPGEIIRRTAKGAMDGYYAELCAANASRMREQLLDGVLVKQGIVSAAAIERDLPLKGDPRDGRELLLLQLYAVEVWASAWSSARIAVAA
jgi:asparagine synthase (glutamine-hydrolysing)